VVFGIGLHIHSILFDRGHDRLVLATDDHLGNVFGSRIRRALPAFAKFVYLHRAEVFTRRRTIVFSACAIILIIILAMPWPLHVEGHFVVEPKQRFSARVSEPGIVETVLVEEGTHVKIGQVVAVLQSPSLHLDRVAAAEELTMARWRLERAQAGARDEEITVALARGRATRVVSSVEGQRLSAMRTLRELEAATSDEVLSAQRAAIHASGRSLVTDAETAIIKAGSREEEIEAAAAYVRQCEVILAGLDERIDRLRIKSPIAGVVIGKRVNERVGEWLESGAIVLNVMDVSQLRAKIQPLRGEALNDVREGQRVRLRVHALSGGAAETSVLRMLPPTDTEALEMETAPFPMTDWRVGMTGRARIYGPNRSVAYRLFAVPLIRVIDYELWRRIWG
jgi:HlyD family secretion protein